MKLTLYCVTFFLLGASIFAWGTYLGVWYERGHTNYWKDATFECIEKWVECEKVCEGKGVSL